MLRIDEDGIEQLNETELSAQEFREDDLREWILDAPRPILNEDILIIGREVTVKGIGDAIDLLGIDRDGKVVVIELKRGALGGGVDFQALKYAAYCSHWEYTKLRDQFEAFKKTKWGRRLYDEETTFTEKLDEFCNEDYALNDDQRVLLVGESIRERLELVLTWLSDRSIDVTVIEVELFRDGDRVYLDANRTIPVQAPERSTELRPDTSDQKWKTDGREWHVTERTNEETGALLEDVVPAIADVGFLSGPEWGQKDYIAFDRNRKRRIAVATKKTLFHIDVLDVPPTAVDEDALAETLDIPDESVEATESLRGGRPGVRITCRPSERIDVDAMTDLVRTLLSNDEN